MSYPTLGTEGAAQPPPPDAWARAGPETELEGLGRVPTLLWGSLPIGNMRFIRFSHRGFTDEGSKLKHLCNFIFFLLPNFLA